MLIKIKEINSQFQNSINPVKDRNFLPNENISIINSSFGLTDTLKIKKIPQVTEPFSKKDEINKYFNNQLAKTSHISRKISQLPDFNKTPFKIGVLVDQKQADFTVPSGTLYIENSEGKKVIGTYENTIFKVKTENNTLALYENETLIGTFRGKIKLEGNLAPVVINSKKYRGEMEIIINPLNPSALNVINNVMIEDYLKGVVPSESPPSWPLESLKAQAVAARTYAISNWKNREAMGFDLMATVSDQVYNGIGVEHPSSSQAVEETRNKVILYNEKPINALFFACSGGYTDSAKEVWNIDLPYIQPVQDFDYNAPKYKWVKTVNNSVIQDALIQLGFQVGAVKSIEPLEFTPQKRVKTIKISGTDGTAIVDSNKFRFAAGLNSTLWTVQASVSKKFTFPGFQKVPGSFTFNGGGWGHGLGMSQWGARQMSLDGKSYEEILRHYYTGVQISELKP